MNRLTVAVAAAMLALPAAMLALPASAIAAPTRGVVLSVDAGHHAVRVINAKHLVHGYRYSGSVPKLRPGSRISFADHGRTISRVRVVGPARSVAFYGRVLRSNGRGVVLRLSDGGTVSFSSKQVSGVRQRMHKQWHRWRSLSPTTLHARTGRVTMNLAPGTIVLITETLSGGHARITVTLPAGATGSRGGGQTNTGASGGGDGSSAGDSGGDVVGTITQLSFTGLTISASGRSMTFTVDPADDLTDGFAIGDLVDVTYDSSSGSPVASDVEYVESDVTGTVTATDTGSLTLTDSDTGQTQTIVADPAEGMFDGVNVNDTVVITYHQSAGQLIADVVDDETVGN